MGNKDDNELISYSERVFYHSYFLKGKIPTGKKKKRDFTGNSQGRKESDMTDRLNWWTDVQMCELDHKAKHWRIDAFGLWCWRRLLKSPLDSKEIKPVNPKGNQPWLFTERTDAEAPILWPPDAKSKLTGKDPDAGKDWRREEKGKTEDEMTGWHHQLNGHEFEQALGVGDGQGNLACSVAHGVAKSWTRLSNWTDYQGPPQWSSGWDFTFQHRGVWV